MTVPAASSPLWLPAAFAVGLVLGLIHFRTLRQVSADYLAGYAGRAALLQMIRLAILVAVLFGLALLGAMDLLAGALGVLAARLVVVGRARKGP